MKIIFTIIIISGFVLSQNSSLDTTTTNIENDFEIYEDNSNTIDNFTEVLYYYRLNPININNAVYSDFYHFPFISHNTIMSILEYRKYQGKINNLGELLEIENINLNEILYIMPYITTKNLTDKMKNSNFNFQSRGKLLSDTSLNFINRTEITNKLSYKTQNFSIFLSQNKKYYNKSLLSYYSYSITLNNLLGNDIFIIGNYKMKFGTGLCFNDGYITRSVLNPNNEIKFNLKNIIPYKGLSPYTISEGVSYTLNLRDFNFTTFYSQKFLSTKLDSNNNIVSIYSSKDDNKTQTLTKRIGGILSYNLDIIYLSFLFDNLHLTKSYILNNKKYSTINTYSLYINFLSRNTIINSEIAYQNKKFIYEISSTYNISKNFTIGHQYIKLANNLLFTSNKVMGFYKQSSDIEIFYNTMSYRFIKENIFAYTLFQKTNPIDINKFNQIDYKYAIGYTNQSSNFISYLFTFQYNLHDYTNNNRKNISTRYSFKISPSSKASYTTDIRITSNTKTTGFAFSEMLNYNITNDLSIKTKLNYFSIESYENIIYTFENDLDGNIASNILYKDGYSAYIILKYQRHNFSLSIKYFYKYQEKITEIIKEKEGSYVVLQFDYEI